MNEFTLNIVPILGFLQTILIILGSFTLFGIMLFLLFGNKNIKILSKTQEKILDKYPMVTEQFLKLSLRQQNVENNQEIHELNLKQDNIESKIHAQNANINRLAAKIEELQNALSSNIK